jgi:hypothetical protein
MASALASANGIEAASPAAKSISAPFGCRTFPGHLKEASSRIHARNRRASAGSEKSGVAGAAPKIEHSLARPERSPLDDYRSSRRQLCGGRFVMPSAPVDGGRWLSAPGHDCSLPQCLPMPLALVCQRGESRRWQIQPMACLTRAALPRPSYAAARRVMPVQRVHVEGGCARAAGCG